ncbi:MAG: hypothetical protein LBQ24_00620 [Candidatus Peribacteria bacterium]|jgi:hypothetical protein|nr:hypothetical protein [Candidatus Peribacteria bacterium]
MTSILPSLSKSFKLFTEKKEEKKQIQYLINISFKILFAFAFMIFVL